MFWGCIYNLVSDKSEILDAKLVSLFDVTAMVWLVKRNCDYKLNHRNCADWTKNSREGGTRENLIDVHKLKWGN